MKNACECLGPKESRETCPYIMSEWFAPLSNPAYIGSDPANGLESRYDKTDRGDLTAIMAKRNSREVEERGECARA